MATFQYRAKDQKGQMLQGTMEAEAQSHVVQRLQSMGYFPFEIEDTTPRNRFGALSRLTRQRVSANDMATLTRQLADLLDAGVPLVRGLSVIEAQTSNLSLKEIVRSIRADVERGDSLSLALAQHPKHFPPLFTSMVKAGETGGILPEVLTRLADFGEAELEIRGKVTSALVYPLFIVVTGVIMVAVMMVVVVPKITSMYSELGSSLPVITEVLIRFTELLWTYKWGLLISLLAAVGAFLKYYRSERGRLRVDRLLLRLPVFGAAITKSEVARFARILGSLLHNGVNILTALEIVGDVVRNQVVRNEIKAMPEQVTQGASVANALKNSQVFPFMVINMMAVGEETGRLDESLLKIAKSYEGEVERTMKTLTDLIGPSVILVIAVIIAFIVVAMLLPIFSIDITV